MAAGVGQHLHGAGASAQTLDWILAAPFILSAVVYLASAISGSRRGRTWPWYRSVFWIAGLAAAAAGFVGPLAMAAHDSFTAHMGAHLLVGMVAPLFLMLAAPVTLALRTMSVVPARRVSGLLRSQPARVLTMPVVAALLSVGGLWAVYLTPLYELMEQIWIVHVAVMLHFLFAGYLFTVSLVAVDPSPDRAAFAVRASVLVLSLAAHGVLAKLLYAHPPTGVGIADARTGAQLMFYGGDLVDFVMIVLLCAEWYRVTGRRLRTAAVMAPPRTQRWGYGPIGRIGPTEGRP